MKNSASQPRLRPGRWLRQLRVGLQVKSALVLTAVVICLTAGGGWFYYRTAQDCLQAADRLHASRLAGAFGLTARDALLQNNRQTIHRLVDDLIHNDSVRNVALLDADGKVVAAAGHADPTGDWKELIKLPVSIADTRQCRGDVLALAKPVLSSDRDSPKVIGAVRLVMDTSSTRAALGRVQENLMVVAAVIVCGWMIVGNWLVWRVVTRPIRRLAAVARKLGQGDYSVRANIAGNDEISELADAFDTMAGEIARGREQMLQARDQLESKVVQRTRDLQTINHRLRQEMVEKEDFLRAVSHDLGAPLRNIAGMAMMAMMKFGAELPEEVRVRLQRIQANVETENQLIGELLELSRISSRPQRRQMVDMVALMDELSRMFEFELRSRGILLTVAKPLPSLYVEKTRIRQVFQNLLDNAIKYMDKSSGGRIDVKYALKDGMHRFSVADNGPGVPADQKQKIFYVFRRAQSAAAAKVPGRGVGLALVKAVAATYEGRTWVEDAPGGQGAVFFVELAEACTGRPAEYVNDAQTCDIAGR